ncbi:ATP-binding cassette domain-containing protein [Roseibium denhamense]|uniref:ATP-binding cassette, subfamily C, LapB n=1 Tax=Roseibium denhamense TaxID=76305 RepID=A0ABY1NI19_9HYPH|nr:ATP-binding cassette domain-containing protein [Roseibium denhamense]MTI06690.1 ATP-binding cassette domain-containing protein [Roseibium denhamense]SMP10367.1 ATP-binding cassette, subfamily C, LapB [Roseibium denhamense]
MATLFGDTFRSASLPQLEFKSSETGDTVKAPGLPRSVIAASIMINVLGLAMPLTILQVYDRILPNSSIDTLVVLIVGLCFVLLIDAVLKTLRSYVVGWSASAFTHKAHVEATRRLLNSRASTATDETVSKQLDALKSLQSLGDQYGGQARLLAIDLPASLIFLAVLFLIGGPIGFIPIILLAIFALRTASLNAKIDTLIEKRAVQDQRKYDFVFEVLSGLNTVKAMALEPVILRRFERLQTQISRLGFDSIDLHNKARNSSGFFTVLTTVCVVALGALLVMGGFISIGAVAACTLLAGQVVQPLLRGINHWTDMQRVKHDYREASALFDLPREDITSRSSVSVAGNIKMQGAGYRAVGDIAVPLQNINLTVNAGETIAFEGSDGSGRSTLVRMMSGGLEPTTGSVLIDGHDLFGPDHRALRREIAYVGNDAEMFSGTILQNLTLFGSRATPHKARMAADLIGLEKDIHLLPLGYDTQMGNSIEENLTDSMLQRIAIARALAGEPKVLVLDDANGALDHKSEAELAEALKRLKGQLTIIIVSHRPSFRAIADKQFLMDGGKVTPVAEKTSAPRYKLRRREPTGPQGAS